MRPAIVTNLLCPSWATLLEWHACESGLELIATLWPKWAYGSPPTLTEFAASAIPLDDRLWLLGRVLHTASRRACLLWAADCAEAAQRYERDDSVRDHALGVIGEARRCAATGEQLGFVIVDAAGAAVADTVDGAVDNDSVLAAANVASYAAHNATSYYAAACACVAARAAAGVAYATYTDRDHAFYSERGWQIALALGYLGVAELPAWPDGMAWR